ncbi:S-adenosyl-L-methionine-dependent methyltransferase [Paraphoma chrysanthemicola]|nr:S-adenosyl-L-methionine-dependent methyltransferase [Paraphoma chrysanthemicola]
MSLYYEAAALLANADNTGGSLKSRLFTKKDLKSSPGQIFALIAEASKWSPVLKDIIEKCRLLEEEKKLTPILALLLSHDLLVAKNGVAAPAGHVLKLAITRHKARLSAEFTKARIRFGHPTLVAFKEAIDNGELEDDEDSVQKATRHPRWVRVNTIKTTLEQQLATTFAGFRKTGELGEVLAARGNAKIYHEDANIPNLFALPSKINLSRSLAYTRGEIIFQDKASCFPAYLLDLSHDDGDAIDGCAAPGNKTTHLAAFASSHNTAGEKQRVIAFERDTGRTVTLQKMVKLASADGIVSIKGGSDFLAAKPNSDEFSNVGAILLDPSCSGTGIVGRDDGIKIHLPSSNSAKPSSQSGGKGKKRKRGDDATKSDEQMTLDVDLHESAPEETPFVGKLAERLATLSNFQLHILTHAMRFASAHKITYSTCSIHFEENEGVVFQALASSIAKERGWRILKREHQVDGMKAWKKRGVWEDSKINIDLEDSHKQEVLDGCIRCDKGTNEGTMGFFVAAFVRDSNETGTPFAAEATVDEDEWNGFSDNGETQINEAPLVGAQPEQSKAKKNKKRKKAKP